MRSYELTGGILRPFWFPFASVYVPVTPCVLDGSLSFLEMVWKLLKDLNTVAEATNNNHTDIMTLAEQIEILNDSKLDYIEVTFTENGGTWSADKTYAEINAAFGNGIVIGRDGNDFYIACGIADNAGRNNPILFYSLNGATLTEFAVAPAAVTRTEIQLITDAGGTITGTLILPDRNPVLPREATPKSYVDTQDAAAIASAKQYTDVQDAATLATAKQYADDGDARTLQSAKDYADAGLALKQDILTLDAEPTQNSMNPARSGGIYSQIGAVAGRMPYMVTAVLDAQNNVTCNETYSNISTRLQTHSATTIVILTLANGNKEIYYMTSVTTNHIDFTATQFGHELSVDSSNGWTYTT